MFQDSFSFELSEKIILTTQEGKEEVDFLLVKAPSVSEYRQTNELEQLFLRAYKSSMDFFIKLKDKKTDNVEEAGKIDCNSVLTIIQMSDIDINLFIDKLGKLLINESCMVGGKVTLTSYLFNQVNRNDRNRLLGMYIANFTIPSWMSQS